jgi:glycosyltransferase involved in cell wall biosynthesis
MSRPAARLTLMRAKTEELLGAEVAGRRRRGPLIAERTAICQPPPKLSVVIPVYNEEAVLPTLFARLYPALDALGIAYECVFVNDGSKDRSVALLRSSSSAARTYPRGAVSCELRPAFGRHGGLAYARGDYVVTLDADLQNPPEEIGKLVACSIRATTMSARSASSARIAVAAHLLEGRSTSCASGSRRCASPIRAA